MFKDFKPTDPKQVLVDLSEQCMNDSAVWFPNIQSSLVHHVLALCGETGEVANIVKKIDRGDLNLADDAVYLHLSEEVTDVFIYLLNVAGLLKLDLLKAYNAKRAFNNERWGK